MLKHASPLRSSPGQPQSQPRATPDQDTSSTNHLSLRDSYSERGVDCDSLVVPASYAQAEKAAGYQVGTWSGVSQANVRRGLSFSSRRAPDALSFRSVRSEGQPTLPPQASRPSSSSSMTNVSAITKEEAGRPCEQGIQYFKGEMPSLKSLLRLPGVRGHAKVIEVTKDGLLLSPETLSLNSADSFFSANSGRTSSRSWSSNASSNSSGTNASTGSNSSTSEPASTTIRVFAKCLRSDIEYKTISVNTRASCREVVALLLSKYRMRHRDPNLFYLTMEVTVRRCSGAPVRSLLVLEDGAKPAQLALCRPPGDSRFALQMRRGGVVKIHDTVLMPGSQYKSLLVSDRTTAEDVVQLLLNCYNRRDNKTYYAIHEVRRNPEFSDRMIQVEERLLEVKARWPRDRQSEFVFVLRRNMAQALSLRKLALRTTEVKWAGDTMVEAVSVPVNTAPPSHPQPAPHSQPVSHSKPAHHPQPAPPTQAGPGPQPAHHPKPGHYPQPAPHPHHAHHLKSAPPPQPAPPRLTLLEGAVIDCTDVTPRMTAINRTQPTAVCASVCAPARVSTTTPEVFTAKTLASGVSARPPQPHTAHGPPPPTTHVSPPPIAAHGPPPPTKHFPMSTTHASLPPPTHAHQPSAAHTPGTRDSATNTEVKVLSNNSTQTVLSRKAMTHPPSALPPPSSTHNHLPPAAPAPSSTHNHLPSAAPAPSTNNLPPNYPPPPPPPTDEAERLPTPHRTLETAAASFLKQQVPSKPQGKGEGRGTEGMSEGPLAKCSEGHHTHLFSSTTSSSSSTTLPCTSISPCTTSTSTSITTTTTTKPDTCKHNCQHCFYI